MSIEIKQHLKLSQQLVMTPQLQQAIKLLQLSRMELVDLVREEMMENPILEDGADTAQEQAKNGEANGSTDGADGMEARAEHAGETELPAPEVSQKVEGPTEVKTDTQAVNEIDWDNYLENYTMAPPMPAYRPNNDELPSLEATLTKKASLFDHLAWQLKLSNFNGDEEKIGMLVIGNLDAAGYLKDVSIEELAQEATCGVDCATRVLVRIQEFDPIGVAARTLEECLLIQARHIGADDEIVVAMIEKHLGNLEKKNYQAIAKDLHQPLEEIVEAQMIKFVPAIRCEDHSAGRRRGEQRAQAFKPADEPAATLSGRLPPRAARRHHYHG